MVVIEILGHLVVVDAFPPVLPYPVNHLESEQMVELFSDHRKATEMQDETQKVSATSSPDPPTLDGPEDRDIDVSHFPPNSAGSYEACEQNQQVVFRGFLETGFPETALVLVGFAASRYKQKMMNFRATGGCGYLEQPVRIEFLGLPNEASQ